MLPVLGCATPQWVERIQRQGRVWPQHTDHTRVLGFCRFSAGSQSNRLVVETSGGFVIFRVTLRSALALNVPHVFQYLSIFEKPEHY